MLFPAALVFLEPQPDAGSRASRTERRVPLSLLRSPCWDPLCDWYPAHSPLLDWAFGLAQLPQEPAQCWLGHSRWQGYLRRLPGAALEGPAPLQPWALPAAPKRGSEISQTVNRWRVPGRPPLRAQELTVKTNDCVVAITGKYGERQKEHGYVSRCLCRKYTLLPTVDPTLVSPSPFPEGRLTLKVPIPRPATQSSEVTFPGYLDASVEHGGPEAGTSEQPGAKEWA
ncbi:heat shock protein beta-1-like [Lontra canadensis]|uniref:heat shock protein beta-1-like n=1 Tax=Lontra canadensis TaxID=76717 RepID=UPI0013F39643|nr:heat shock protein beta-1-like [Lontra canadensis]